MLSDVQITKNVSQHSTDGTYVLPWDRQPGNQEQTFGWRLRTCDNRLKVGTRSYKVSPNELAIVESRFTKILTSNLNNIPMSTLR